MKILLIKDEPKTVGYLRKSLGEEGFIVDVAVDGDQGLHFAKSFGFDLIILDVMLPFRDGWQVVTELRRTGQQTPVLFLTAHNSVLDRVKGFELGADDCLVNRADLRGADFSAADFGGTSAAQDLAMSACLREL